MKITIKQAKGHLNQDVTIGAWLTSKRLSGKTAFLQLHDGIGFIQGVVVKSEVDEGVFKLAKEITQESSLYVVGTITKDNRSDLGYGMQVKSIEVISEAHDYPITPKSHGTEFLMDYRHLWLRSRKQHAIMKIRNEVIRATYEFFNKDRSAEVNPLILTANAPEGTSGLFHTKYFDQDAFLPQSGRLYLEAAAMAHGKVLSFGPTLGAEKSKTRRHLIEFWMTGGEMAFTNHTESLEIQERYVTRIVKSASENCKLGLRVLECDTSKLEKVATSFPRISYDDAIESLKAEGFDDIKWGEDFGAPHETATANRYDLSVFITNYPIKVEPFYMQPNPENEETILCADLITPEGYGEIIGGSKRVGDLESLERHVKEHRLDEEAYSYYLDLRRYGSVPHCGFGLGLERTVTWISGVGHVHEVAPFPRLLNRLYP